MQPKKSAVIRELNAVSADLTRLAYPSFLHPNVVSHLYSEVYFLWHFSAQERILWGEEINGK